MTTPAPPPEPAILPVWPPALSDLVYELDNGDTVEHEPAELRAIQRRLDAAVQYVQRVRKDVDYNGAGEVPYAPPNAEMIEGTLMLARRMWERRNSPAGIIFAGDVGTTRVPVLDPDIERLLRIGRYRKSVFA